MAGSVMVWAGIRMQWKMDLLIIGNGTMTAVCYVNKILDFCVRPNAGAFGLALRAHDANQYLEDHTIVRMDWPARSPDINPMEYAWNMLQKAISVCQLQPT